MSWFITDGRLQADTNIAENAIRCVALGRKDFLFAGSDAGGDRTAAIYTIVQTVKLIGLNPEAYLRDVLTRIADGHPSTGSTQCSRGTWPAPSLAGASPPTRIA